MELIWGEVVKSSLMLIDYVLAIKKGPKETTEKFLTDGGKWIITNSVVSLFPNANKDYVDGLTGILIESAVASVKTTESSRIRKKVSKEKTSFNILGEVVLNLDFT